MSLTARTQHRIPSCSSQFQLFGNMVPSGLTFHPEKNLLGERIERHTVVTTAWYGYPIGTTVLTDREAGNWKRKEEDLKVYITGTLQGRRECETGRHQKMPLSQSSRPVRLCVLSRQSRSATAQSPSTIRRLTDDCWSACCSEPTKSIYLWLKQDVPGRSTT